MIGDFTTAITANNRDRTGVKNVSRIGIASEGKDRGMLEKPHLIRGVGVPLCREFAHGVQHRKVREQARPAANE
jgi:hypothetical protein